ncbi:NUDIX hydrolase [Candidatus Berkelbacteria bacterium]|nr:NUDIX hydrolase [Candidatus Berkelbacteria bacterium]
MSTQATLDTPTLTRVTTQVVVSGAIVLNERNEVLLTRRHQPELPDAHGRWEMPAGKVEWNESPHQTAVREVLEETGFVVEADPTRVAVKDMVWNFPTKDVHTILLAYRCRLIGGERRVPGGKIADVRWWPVHGLPLDNILPLDDEFIFELTGVTDPRGVRHGSQ